MATTWKVDSETLEPMLKEAIGIFWDECDHAGGFNNIEALKVFWHKLDALQAITVINGAPHAVIAMGNQIVKVGGAISAKTGLNPVIEKW